MKEYSGMIDNLVTVAMTKGISFTEAFVAKRERLQRLRRGIGIGGLLLCVFNVQLFRGYLREDLNTYALALGLFIVPLLMAYVWHEYNVLYEKIKFLGMVNTVNVEIDEDGGKHFTVG